MKKLLLACTLFLFLGCSDDEKDPFNKARGQQVVIIIDSGAGNNITVTQGNGPDSTSVIINGNWNKYDTLFEPDPNYDYEKFEPKKQNK